MRAHRARKRRGKRAPAAARRRPQAVDRLDLVTRAINEGVYDWDIATGKVDYSERVRNAVGLTREQLGTAADWHRRIHPEDRPRYDAALVEHFKGRTERFECDYRYRTGDGCWRWARQHGVAQRDARGRAVRMIGSTGDITELKQAAEALKASEERYALATRAATEGIYEWNVQTGSLYLSDRDKAVFAIAGEALTAAAWNARVHGEDFPAYRDAIRAYFKGDTAQFEHEYRIRNAAGSYAWVLDRGIARRDAGGRVTHMLGALTDITQRKLGEIELRRARDAAEQALEQQTATAEILHVISSSSTDTKPVFEAIVDACRRLFPDCHVGINLVDDAGGLYLSAVRGANPELKRYFEEAETRRSGTQVRLSGRVAHYPDIEAADVPGEVRRGCRAGGVRSIIFAPLVLNDKGIGSLWVARLSAGSFADRAIALLKTFASQAVIAIENVRLFNETKEALERQTATSEVLRVISASPTHVQPVLDTIAERAASLCAAKIGFVARFDGKLLHMVAVHGVSAEALETIRALYPIDPESGGSVAARVIRSGAAVQIADVFADDSYAHKEAAQAAGYRSAMGVPLMREGQIVGAIIVVRSGAGEFAPKQVELLKIFADQAVIAIENARLFREIQEKSAQLEVATKHKSDFLANMSHELRTPLNAIIGFTRIVQRNAVGRLEPRQLENLEKIQASGEHLLALINAVLDLSKVEAGRVEVSAREVEIAPVLEHCLRTVEPLVKPDVVSLDREFDGGLPTMFVDDEKLRQIVINLLSNAAKFTARGTIRLGAHADGDSVTIAVTDTGIGIAADMLDVIFEEFRQADTDSTRAHSGTGLGLAIARRLARIMGGDIDAASEPGLGSTFTLTLPLRYVA